MASSFSRQPQPGLAGQGGVDEEAVARLTQERRVERQKAMELKELNARAQLTSASAVPAQCADPEVQMITFWSVVL